MQQMQDATNSTPVAGDDHAQTTTPQQVAAALMEVAPAIMRAIRAQMRSQRTADLSVPQFRVLTLLRRRPGSSLSDVAEHVGLTVSAASRLVDGLVARGYVERELSAADRRAVALALSPKGASLLESTSRGTQAQLAERLAVLDAAQREAVLRALEELGALFQTERRARTASEPRETAGPSTPEAPDSQGIQSGK